MTTPFLCGCQIVWKWDGDAILKLCACHCRLARVHRRRGDFPWRSGSVVELGGGKAMQNCGSKNVLKAGAFKTFLG
jgi:hypothetical protein